MLLPLVSPFVSQLGLVLSSTISFFVLAASKESNLVKLIKIYSLLIILNFLALITKSWNIC